MTRRVVYSPRAERHLKELYDWIATASSPETAERYMLSIFDHCDRLGDFPMIGVAHDDIRPGLRTIGFRRRAVIAFTVTETNIEINGVYYGGRDIDSILLAEHE